MKTIKIKKDQFLSDYETMKVKDIKVKYKLTNDQYYRVLDQIGIERRKKAAPKKIEVVD